MDPALQRASPLALCLVATCPDGGALASLIETATFAHPAEAAMREYLKFWRRLGPRALPNDEFRGAKRLHLDARDYRFVSLPDLPLLHPHLLQYPSYRSRMKVPRGTRYRDDPLAVSRRPDFMVTSLRLKPVSTRIKLAPNLADPHRA